jgi:anti-anti-sigma factor
LWCCSRTVDDLIVLEVIPDTTPTCEDIQRLSDTLVASGSVLNVLVDLSDVEFVNSSFIARLLALNKQLRGTDGKLILSGLRLLVREIFCTLRLDTFLDIPEDKECDHK